jgi:hypothetical protein
VQRTQHLFLTQKAVLAIFDLRIVTLGVILVELSVPVASPRIASSSRRTRRAAGL